jgi:hypothetical protein
LGLGEKDHKRWTEERGKGSVSFPPPTLGRGRIPPGQKGMPLFSSSSLQSALLRMGLLPPPPFSPFAFLGTAFTSWVQNEK